MAAFVKEADDPLLLRPTIVYSSGKPRWSSCGYCHGKESCIKGASGSASDNENDSNSDSDNESETEKSTSNSVMFYVLGGESLSAASYQLLIDEGWRRSGRVVYRGYMDSTCCPAYTIRMDAGRFEPTKSQKKIVRKVSNWIAEGGNVDSNGASSNDESTNKNNSTEGNSNQEDNEEDDSNNVTPHSLMSCYDAAQYQTERAQLTTILNSILESAHHTISENAMEDVQKSNNNTNKSKSKSKTKSNSAPIFGEDRPWEDAIRFAERCHSTGEPDSGLHVVLEPATFTEETFQVYSKYQQRVHGDSPSKVTRSGFVNFLVDSPIPLQKSPNSEIVYGSYHQKYYINGKLIAVSVLDILPNCLSGVYFMYDPDYASISPGSYSSLREIALTRLLLTLDRDIKHYYMGFYIHSCPKMRYKAQYLPSQLKCLRTNKWIDVLVAQKFLDVNKRAKLPEDPSVQGPTLDSQGQIETYHEPKPESPETVADLESKCIIFLGGGAFGKVGNYDIGPYREKLLVATCLMPTEVKPRLAFLLN